MPEVDPEQQGQQDFINLAGLSSMLVNQNLNVAFL